MPVAFAFLWAVVSVAAGTLLTIAATIVTTLGTIVAAAVDLVGGIVSAATQKLGALIANAVKVVGTTAKAIVTDIAAGIQYCVNIVNTVLQPILKPIQTALEGINAYVTATQKWVKQQLDPYRQVVELIDTITALAVMRDLTDMLTNVSRLLGDSQQDKEQATLQSIAELSAGIAKTTVGTIDMVRLQVRTLHDRVDGFEKTIKANFEKRMVELESSLIQTIAGVRDNLTGRSITIQRQVDWLSRMITDKPWFLTMLVRVLS